MLSTCLLLYFGPRHGPIFLLFLTPSPSYSPAKKGKYYILRLKGVKINTVIRKRDETPELIKVSKRCIDHRHDYLRKKN